MEFPRDFPIAKKWPPRHPERLQLYSLGTPNGMKPIIMLEEAGLPYDYHAISFAKDEQHSAEFLSLNPNGKIPAIIDPIGPGAKPLALWESAAILLYLAERTGRFLPSTQRWQVIQWLAFQVAGVGPMFGQLGYFHHFAGKEIEDKRPRDRYAAEARRLLKVIDDQLAARQWITGADFTIADMAIFPMVRNLIGYYEAGELVGFADFKHVARALEDFLARPAVKRAYEIAG